MSVNDASALEDTLERLRRRYTLYFSLPEGVQPGQERNIEVDLAPEARRRFSDAEVRYRRTFQSPLGRSRQRTHPSHARARRLATHQWRVFNGRVPGHYGLGHSHRASPPRGGK